MPVTARETVRAYYAALRAGDPLGRFFADARAGDDPVVKVGISERLVGTDAVREGLRAGAPASRSSASRGRSRRRAPGRSSAVAPGRRTTRVAPGR